MGIRVVYDRAKGWWNLRTTSWFLEFAEQSKGGFCSSAQETPFLLKWTSMPGNVTWQPVWKSRFPSCPLYQVSIWYVVLPARPVSLESTVEFSNAENHTGDPVRVQKSSELLMCKIWLSPLDLDYPSTLNPAPRPAAAPPSSTSGPPYFLLWTSGIATGDYGQLLPELCSNVTTVKSPALTLNPNTTFIPLKILFFIYLNITFKKLPVLTITRTLIFTYRKSGFINPTSPSFSPWDVTSLHSGPVNLTTHMGLPTMTIIHDTSGDGCLFSVSIMVSWSEYTVKRVSSFSGLSLLHT